MKFTDLFIKRPVFATVINLLILLAGILAIAKLNIREYPDVRNSQITVTTTYPGASADLVRGFVTTPLEREIASADGIDYIESNSSQNVSVITARLRLNYDPNEALTQITAKVNKAKGDLPRDSENPIIEISAGQSTAAIYLSFSSNTLDSNQITDYLTRVVQPKLSTVEGVQNAEILGARTFAMRLWIKPDRLTAYGISPAQLRAIIETQNYLSAIGSTKGAWVVSSLNAQTDIKTVEEFKKLVVKEYDGKIVYLRDVADVVLGAEDYESSVKMGSQSATFMAVNALPTANSIDVVRRVRAIFPDIVRELPRGLEARIPYDSTIYINDSINEVVKTLIEAILIVVVVIYLFLGSFRSVLIPVVAIPLSLIGGVFLMMLMGFSINLLTLLAMVLAIGIVVDDAIVVVENIHRIIEEGNTPLQASFKGAAELVGPVIAMTITLLAVYAPIGLQSGLTGLLFKEFAFTLAGSVLISGIVALTLSPMLCSRILKHDVSPTGLAHRMDVLFDKIKALYSNTLGIVLQHRGKVYAIAVILLISIIPFYNLSKKELSPTEDRGFVLCVPQAQSNSSIEQVETHIDRLVKSIESYDEVQQVFGVAGYPARNGGFVGCVLKPASQRHRTTQQMLPFLKKDIAAIAGIFGSSFIPPSLPGAGSGLPVQYVVSSTSSSEQVADVANELLKRAMASGKFYYGDSDLKFDLPQVDILIDREKAAKLGINMQRLGADLGTLLSGAYVNRFSLEGRSYKVIPQVTRSRRLTPQQLDNYYIATASGKMVPLSTIAKLKSSVQPRQLKRFQQLNSATVSLLPADGVSLSDAYEFLNSQAREIFPQGFTADTAGELRQYVEEGSSLITTFLLAIIVIYLVLAAQYESFRDPFIILMSVPLAITGALVFIFLGFSTVNIYTQVGLLTLVGLIAKNGILIVEFANQLREQGRDALTAIQEAAAIRLRPILMTTFAMVFGVFPLLLAHGPGAASRFSIGLVIASGMAIGTFFTLFVIPSFYLLISKKQLDAPTPSPTKI